MNVSTVNQGVHLVSFYHTRLKHHQKCGSAYSTHGLLIMKLKFTTCTRRWKAKSP